MGAGLAGRLPCLSHNQGLMEAGLAGRPPCLPQSGPYGCWVNLETSLSTTQQVLMGAG